MSFDELFLEQLVKAVQKARLEAIIVGTVAASLQGAPILTQDVDLLVRDTKVNRKKLRVLCELLGAAQTPISELSKGIMLTGAAFRVDVLFDRLSGGLTFASIKSRRREAIVGRATATVADLADVIASKEAAGRPKDLAQLPILRDTLKVRAELEARPKGRAGRRLRFTGRRLARRQTTRAARRS